MIYKNEHLDLASKSVLHHVIFEPPLRVLESMHDEACYVFSVNGTAEIFGANHHQTLYENEGVLMKCGKYVNKWQAKVAQEPTEIFIVKLYPDMLKEIFQDGMPEVLKRTRVSASAPLKKIETDQMIKSYVQSIRFYFQNPSLVNDELVILKVKELILLLINADQAGTITHLLAGLFSPDSFSIREVVEAHWYDDLSLEELASLSSMSVSSFKRKFRETYQDTPSHYIKTKRLARACNLLRTTPMAVSEIGYECGFNDPGYFTKVFRSQYQITPTEYRADGNK